MQAIPKNTISFLKELKLNNNREWFNENKDRFNTIRNQVKIFAQEVNDSLNYIDESVYKGWMISSSPDVTPLEHPIYDLWLVDCKVDKIS